jgi:hypothetical protein
MNLLELLDHLQLHGEHLQRFAEFVQEATNVRVVSQLLRNLLRGQLKPLLLARQELREDASPASRRFKGTKRRPLSGSSTRRLDARSGALSLLRSRTRLHRLRQESLGKGDKM